MTSFKDSNKITGQEQFTQTFTRESLRKYDPNFSSWVIAACGGRGSGKTLLLTIIGCEDMIAGYNVFSNFHIHCEWKGKRYESKPLNMDALAVFSGDLSYGTMILDEAQGWLSSRRSMTTASMLVSHAVAQVRKRNLRIAYSTKFPTWVDSRLRQETDAEAWCSDTYFSPEGFEARSAGKPTKKGSTFLLRWKDLSGCFTGQPFHYNPKEYIEFMSAEWAWNCYDTAEEVSGMDSLARYEIVMPVKRIEFGRDAMPGEAAGKSDSIQLPGSLRSVGITEDLNKLSQLVSGFKDAGRTEFTVEDFWAAASANGISAGPKALGQYLKSFGIVKRQSRRGNFYQLPEPGEVSPRPGA